METFKKTGKVSCCKELLCPTCQALFKQSKEFEEIFNKIYNEIVLDEFSYSVCEQTGECLEHQKMIKIKLDKIKSSITGEEEK